MNLNKNRLLKAKRKALLQNKLNYAKGFIAICTSDAHPYIKAMQIEMIQRMHNGQIDRIRWQVADPFDVLDVTQMGSDFPIMLEINSVERGH